jgi:hypothetical protein
MAVASLIEGGGRTNVPLLIIRLELNLRSRNSTRACKHSVYIISTFGRVDAGDSRSPAESALGAFWTLNGILSGNPRLPAAIRLSHCQSGLLEGYAPFGIEGNDVFSQKSIADVEFPRPPVAASALSPKDDFR